MSSVKPSGSGKFGQQRLAELDVELGPLGDPQRVVARLRHLAEQVAHLVGGLEVVLVALELEALRIAISAPGLHAQQRVVRLVVLAVGVVRVVGGEQRGADPLGDLDQLRVRVALRRQAVVLQLDEQVVLAEDVLQPAGLLERALARRPAAAPAARGRRGSRWWRSGRRGSCSSSSQSIRGL